MPRTNYEANFGYYDLETEGEMEFFCHVKANSVVKECIRCEEKVRLLPDRNMCARCAEALEFAGE
jgi:hypothetical protein